MHFIFMSSFKLSAFNTIKLDNNQNYNFVINQKPIELLRVLELNPISYKIRNHQRTVNSQQIKNQHHYQK